MSRGRTACASPGFDASSTQVVAPGEASPVFALLFPLGCQGFCGGGQLARVLVRFVSILFLTFVLVFCAPPASAEQHNTPPASAPAKPEGMQISILTLTLLIKGAVMALQQANMTGNYSVLRDLGTPVFRETFDQATLTAIFQQFCEPGKSISALLSCFHPI